MSRRWARLRRPAVVLLVAAALGLVTAGPALAYAPVGVVHTERVQAGPYTVTVGFSVWPIRAMQSLDFTFVPDGGIDGKSGRLLLDGPGIKADDHDTPLVRHPRKLDSWGLDVQSFGAEGDYRIGFAIDGPQGHGEGALTGIGVLPQPGPPLPLSWAVAALPAVGLVAFLVVGWRRVRPGRSPVAV